MDNFGIRTYCSMSTQILEYSLIFGIGMKTSDLNHFLLLSFWPNAGGPDSFLDHVAFIAVQKLGDVN